MKARGSIAGLLLLSSSSVALASPAPTHVVLVHPAGEHAVLDEATLRVRAELVAAGFEVEMRDTPLGPSEEDERDLSRRSGATIRLFGEFSGAVAEIRIDDPIGGKAFARRIEIPRGTRHPAALLALRAVEQLRASLLEVSSDPPPVKESVAEAPHSPPVAQASTEASKAREPLGTRLMQRPAMEAGLVFMYGFGGFGASFAPLLRISTGLAPRLAMRLAMFGPTLQGDVTAPSGRASIVQAIGEAECVWSLAGPRARIVPTVSFGVGGSYVGVSGSAVAPYQAHHARTVVALADGGVGAAYRIGDRAAMVIDGHALFMIPEPAVRIANVTARTGHPSIYFSAGFLTQF